MRNVIAPTVIAALVLSACSGTGGLSSASPSPTALSTTTISVLGSPSPTGTATGATSTPAATTAQASPAATGTAGTSSATNVCSLAQKTDVEAVIGTLVTTATTIQLPLPGFTATACVYASNDGALTIALGPRGLGRTEFEAGARLVPGATAVSGVGDSAFSIRTDIPSGAAGAASIVALKGSTYFTVQATSRTKSSDALLAGITELAKKVAGSL